MWICRETGAEDVYIRVICCGLCHTDIHQIKNELGMSNYPMVPGLEETNNSQILLCFLLCLRLIMMGFFGFWRHEVVGEVVEIGKNVKRFKVKDIVGVGCIVGSCKICERCGTDREQYCNYKIWTNNDVYTDGRPTQGGFAAAMVVDQK